jgi:hypothetical protein
MSTTGVVAFGQALEDALKKIARPQALLARRSGLGRLLAKTATSSALRSP